MTVVTHFLDLSIVYGSSNEIAAGLRAGVGGRLIVEVRGNREWLPSSQNRTADCEQFAQVCYRSGKNLRACDTYISYLPYELYQFL